MANTALVLIPGAGMSDWIWEATKDLFSIPVIMITNRLDENTYARRKSATLKDCADHIITILNDSKFDSFIVVGHSGAGSVAAKVCQAIPEKIVRVIYVAANIPKHDHTMIDSLPFFVRIINILAIRKMIKKDSMPYSRIEKVIREKFCNDSDEAVIQNMISRKMNAEPICAITEKMNWDGFPKLNQTYMILLKDRTLTVKRQKYMASNLNIDHFVEIESDHMVMLSHPIEFAAAINKLVAEATTK